MAEALCFIPVSAGYSGDGCFVPGQIFDTLPAGKLYSERWTGIFLH